MENEKALANLVKALEQGQAFEVVGKQIEARTQEGEVLKLEISREKLSTRTLSKSEILHFFDQYKGGDINDPLFRKALLNLFVDKVYLFEGKNGDYVDIHCNAFDKSKENPTCEPLGSHIGSLCDPYTKTVICFLTGAHGWTRKNTQIPSQP